LVRDGGQVVCGQESISEEALEAAGLEERREALEDAGLGGWRVAGHFAELHGGGAQVFRAQDIGDAFDVVVVADEAPGQAIAVVSVNYLDELIGELEADGVVCAHGLPLRGPLSSSKRPRIGHIAARGLISESCASLPKAADGAA
jgi:hypothetical protein